MRLRELLHLYDPGCLETREHQLRDPLTPTDRDTHWAPVLEEHSHLSSVVGIDGPGAVGQRDAEAGRQPRPGSDLTLYPGREAP